MKNLSYAIALVAFSAAMMSCERDWTCICDTDSGTTSSGDTLEVQIRNATKGEAQDICENREGDVTQGGITVSTTCELQ